MPAVSSVRERRIAPPRWSRKLRSRSRACSRMDLISAGTPGSARRNFPSRSTQMPGACPTGLERGIAERGIHAWRRTCSRAAMPPLLYQLLQPCPNLRMLDRLFAEELAECLDGEVVMGRSQPTGGDDAIAALPQAAELSDDLVAVVTNGDVAEDLKAQFAALLRNPCGVGIYHLPNAELIADAHDSKPCHSASGAVVVRRYGRTCCAIARRAASSSPPAERCRTGSTAELSRLRLRQHYSCRCCTCMR
jgi:hypothetical protein